MVCTFSPVILPSPSNASLRLGDVIAAMRVGDETFRALAGPFHRTADEPRRPQADDFFRIDENLRAEAAADIRRDHAQLVFRRHADEGRNHQPRDMRILRGVPQRKAFAARIVIGERGARLHRIRHQPVVDELQRRDVLGGLERGRGRIRIADMPVVDRVVGRGLVNLRRAFCRGLGGIDHRRQHLIVDDDFFRRVLGLRQRFGDHDRDRVADVVGLVRRNRRMRRHLHRRAVLGKHGPAADQSAKFCRRKIRAGQHRDDAGHAGRGLGVDLFDFRVRMRRTDEIDVGLARTIDVVRVLTLAGNETKIFLAANRSTDPGRTHGSSSRNYCRPVETYGSRSTRRPCAFHHPWPSPWRRRRLP